MPDYGSLRLETERRLARVSLALLVVPTVWFVRRDISLAIHGDALLLSRLAVRVALVSTCVVAVWQLRPRLDRERVGRILLVAGLVTAVLILGLSVLRPRGTVLPIRTPLLWIAAYYAVLTTDPRRHVIAPLLVSAGYAILRSFYVTTGDDLLGDVMILLLFNVMGLALVWHREELARTASGAWAAEREAQDTARRAVEELSALRGIIPICANCRKVRDERNSWDALEAYVRTHTSTRFSHGICPDCERLLYPEATLGSGT